MLTVVVWTTTAWFFGIPTSETHELLAGLAGDFSYHKKFGVNNYTFLAGPRFTSRSYDRVTPFCHVMFGLTRLTAGSQSINGFALQAGGGVDVKVTKNVAIRALEADYMMTRISGEINHHILLKTGVVLRW